jgi:putative membrane protein
MKRSAALVWVGSAGVVLVAALAPPMDELADASFAWHMTQHLVLFFAVPLLALAARPFEIFAAFAGKHVTAGFVRITQPLHALAKPSVALAIFIATLWVTHFSGLYELALEHEPVHLAEHAFYITAGLIFWLPVLAPPPLHPLNFPARLLYLVLALPQGAFLALALESARTPLYRHYAVVAGSNALAVADQRDAAAVMWILGGLIVFSAFLITLTVWARREADAAALV